MSRMLCRCGEELSNSGSPEIEFSVYSDAEWLKTIDLNEAGNKLLDIGLPSISYWKCPNCKRLYFFEDGNDIPISIYRLEEE